MIVVGIAGQKGSGKDVIAGHLVDHYGFVRIGFADALKHEALARLPRTLDAYLTLTWGDHYLELPPERQAAMRHDLVWRYKPIVIRELLQELGTEVRRADDPDYWVKAWEQLVARHAMDVGREYARALAAGTAVLGDWQDLRVVVPDVRFPNEIQAITRQDGVVVAVERPGFSGDAHASERSLDTWSDWEHIFINHSTPEALVALVDLWIQRFHLTAPAKPATSR